MKYLISTAMGNSLLDPDDKVYVQVSPRRFLLQKVQDLREGSLVVFSKPYTTTDLEHVEPFLTKSPRYARSKELLHELNKHGVYVPKLRTFSIRGLAMQNAVDRTDLEARILFEDNHDFQRNEYKTMCSGIVDVLRAGERTDINYANIMNWLEGNVIAPRDWSIFTVLSEVLNPAFSLFRHGDADPNSLYFNYRLYVVVRQGVMRFLNRARGTTSPDGWQEGDSLISLTPEYQIVLDHFLKDLTKDDATARVFDIKKITRDGELEHVARDRLICNGIVLQSPKNDLVNISLDQVIEEMEVLGDYIGAAVEKFDCGDLFYDPTDRRRHVKPNRFVKYGFCSKLIPDLLATFNEENDPEMERARKVNAETSLGSKEADAAYKLFVSRITEAILSGEMDSHFSFERGTMMRLLESYVKTRGVIPRRIFEYQVSTKELLLDLGQKKVISRTEKRARQRDIVNRQKSIEKLYNLCFDQYADLTQGGEFMSNILRDTATDNGVSPLEFIDKIKSRIPLVKQLLPQMKKSLKRGVYVRDKQHIEKILQEHGLDSIIDLREEDFLFVAAMA